MAQLTVRPVTVDQVAAQGPLLRSLSLSAEECAAVATRAEMPAVVTVAAQWTLTAAGPGGILAKGRVQATLTLTCGASGQPFDQAFDFTTQVTYLPASALPEEDADPWAEDWESEGDVEALEEEQIDLTEATIQALLLEVPAFPRKPDLAPVDRTYGDDSDIRAAQESPFAQLKDRVRPKDES